MTEGTGEALGEWAPDDDEAGSIVIEERDPDGVVDSQVPPPRPPITRESIMAAGPPQPGIWAAIVYAICTMSLGYPALAGKFLAGPNSDQFIAGYSFREFGASMLASTGSFAQWNPYLFGGMPYIAAMHGDIFYPTFLLRMVMPTDSAMTWSFMLHLFLAGLFAYRFVRASGFGFYPALIAGIAYMMSGQLASLVSPGHDGKLSVSALFPLTLWMLTLGIRDGRRWSWGVLAGVIGLAVLSPHPQLLQYLLLASGAFALYLAISGVRRGDMDSRAAWSKLALALGAVVIGLAIGAIQYLPVREYVAWSPRAGGLADYDTATSYAWPLKELFDAYLPQFTGMIEAYWGENMIHLHSDYMGAVVLLLAGGSLIGIVRDSRRGFLLFWVGAFVIALLWALGGHTPFYRIPYAIVPGTKYFRAPATVFFVGTMALAVLAAAGVERLLMRQMTVRYPFAWLGFALVVVVLGSLGILTDFAQALAPEQMVDAVIANSLEVVIGAWRSFAFILLAVAAMGFYLRGKIGIAAVGWALAFLMAADSWTIMRKYWVFSPPASVSFATDSAIDRILADREPSRVLALELEPNRFRDPNLQGDGLMAHRIRTVLGYHGNQLGRYNEILEKDRGFQQVINPKIWQIYNVRYLLTNTPDVEPLFPGSTRLLGPVKDAAGTPTYLFRLPGENPYGWVAPVIVKAEDEAVRMTMMNPAFDVDRAALFAADANVTAVTGLEMLPLATGIAAKVTQYAPGRVSLELDSPAPRGAALVVSENYFPGWTATVDGHPAAVGRADFTLVGVQLPEGGKKVELRFDDPAYETGKLITIVAIMLTLLLIAAGMFLERRARA